MPCCHRARGTEPARAAALATCSGGLPTSQPTSPLRLPLPAAPRCTWRRRRATWTSPRASSSPAATWGGRTGRATRRRTWRPRRATRRCWPRCWRRATRCALKAGLLLLLLPLLLLLHRPASSARPTPRAQRPLRAPRSQVDLPGGPTALHDCGGSTALHLAAAGGHAGCVRQLLAAGAAPAREDFRGHTPLQVRARCCGCWSRRPLAAYRRGCAACGAQAKWCHGGTVESCSRST
jgi:hypothetical protein